MKRDQMVDAILNHARKLWGGDNDGKELSLRLTLAVSSTDWIAEQYAALGLNDAAIDAALNEVG